MATSFADALSPLARTMPRAARNIEILRVSAQLDGEDFAASSNAGVCQISCPPNSCGVSDFRGAVFAFWVQPDGSCGLPVAGIS